VGEYAIRKCDGAEIKIGTCEDMYYLRADQRHQVTPLDGNADPGEDDVATALRFRFPWPDEDRTPPGEFERYDRAVWAPGVATPAGVEHYSVQFVARAGYLVSLPCPESLPGQMFAGVHIGRNGFAGVVQLVQQKLLADGRLVPVCRCGGCGTAWRVEEPADIEALAVAFRSEGDRAERDGRHNGTGAADRAWWDQIADRILAGARLASAAV
jgi:hypothetical protein